MSKFLEGFVVLFSGVDELKKTKAKEAVLRYGGKCVDKYTKEVNCGVVGKVGSAGFKELLNAKVSILTMKWLQDCASTKALAPVESPQYKVGLFSGLNVVCTQFSIEERNQLQETIEANYGTFSDRFVGNMCTHLIAKTPSGDKYMGAKKCGNIRIVTMAWVEECVKQKVWVPELEFSVDLLARKAQREALALKNKLDSSKLSKVTETTVEDQENLNTNLSLVELMEQYLLKDFSVQNLPAFHNQSEMNRNVFEGEIFWIAGFPTGVVDYITSCILAGGGLRSMVLCDAVTVVLIGESAQSSDWTLARRHPCGVLFVNIIWVLEQLFSVRALLPLFQEKTPLAEFFQSIATKIDNNNDTSNRDDTMTRSTGSSLDTIDDLCEEYSIYVSQLQPKQQPSTADMVSSEDREEGKGESDSKKRKLTIDL